jgi:hypothetical protein
MPNSKKEAIQPPQTTPGLRPSIADCRRWAKRKKMRAVGIFLIVLVTSGCAPMLKEKPALVDVVGSWEMSKLNPSAFTYLANSGARVDEKKKPRFELLKDGTLSASRLPLDIAQGKAITVEASGTWRLIPPVSKSQGWTLALLLTEPKRGLNYDFHKDGRGLILRGSFDPEDPGSIEFRRTP